MTKMDDEQPEIQELTRAMAALRKSSVFAIEITHDGNDVLSQSHATLNDSVLPRDVVLETLVKSLETALEVYKKALAELPERSGT